jgi:hypothetical protein
LKQQRSNFRRLFAGAKDVARIFAIVDSHVDQR